MTIERRLARVDFTLTRDYTVPRERVWDAFAEEEQKLDWWGAGDAVEPGEWVFDFRVGGRDVDEGTFHQGPVSRYEATYTDIVEHGVFFDQLWADRPNREGGTRVLHALAKHLT